MSYPHSITAMSEDDALDQLQEHFFDHILPELSYLEVRKLLDPLDAQTLDQLGDWAAETWAKRQLDAARDQARDARAA